EQTRNTDRVLDPAVANQRRDVPDRNQLDGQLLAWIGSGFGDSAGVADEDCRDSHGDERRVRPEDSEPLGGIPGISGLLQKLPSSGGARISPQLEKSSRRLQAVPPCCGTELADHHELVLRGQGDDLNAIGYVSDEEVVGLAASSRAEPLAPQPEEPGLNQT